MPVFWRWAGELTLLGQKPRVFFSFYGPFFLSLSLSLSLFLVVVLLINIIKYNRNRSWREQEEAEELN